MPPAFEPKAFTSFTLFSQAVKKMQLLTQATAILK
jgi:hypothetical protein